MDSFEYESIGADKMAENEFAANGYSAFVN